MMFQRALILILIFLQLLSPLAMAANGSDASECMVMLSDVKELKASRELRGAEKHDAMLKYGAPRKKNWFDKSFVIADYAMAAAIGVGLAIGFYNDPKELIPAALMVPPTLFTADLISQFFHKWLDSYASESSRIWGTPAREFRKHHEVPSNLNNVDYLSHVSAFGKLMAPAFVMTTALVWSGNIDPAEGTALWLLSLSLLNTTEFHKQAHKPDPNLFWRAMQKVGLALRKHTHGKHHKDPFDTHYAVFNGWSHIVTEGTQFWKWMDRIWWKTFRKLPNNWIHDPRSLPPEVLAELEADLSQIPPEILVYSEIYPKRITPEIEALLKKVQPDR